MTGQLEKVVFHWSTANGRCYECGLPAAFHRHDLTGKTKLCAVCAANAAADDEIITRIGVRS